MMKRLGILILLLVIALFFGIVVFPQKNFVQAPSTLIPSPTKAIVSITRVLPTNPQGAFCTLQDISAVIVTEGAAGNIYGTLTMKNISSQKCMIEGNKFINATLSASNIVLSKQGQIGPAEIVLLPSQSVYSQIHFPNGPQCSSTIKQIPVTFTYQMSPISTVAFNPSGSLPVAITACSSPSENTQLDVWSISLQPLH